MADIKAVCVFCGAQNAVPKAYLDAGAEFGKRLAEQGITLVYGGGDCGVMGAVANAVLDNGGKAIGVFPVSLRQIENEHDHLTEIIIVNTMHERKQKMFELSQAIVVLPGGFGTLDEMFEILTWKQLRIHEKPVIIHNQLGYWNPLVKLMNVIITTGFAKPETSTFYKVVESVDGIMEAMVEAKEPQPLIPPVKP